jgi:hypothetical protein
VEGSTILVVRYPFPWDLLVRLALALPSGSPDLVEDAMAIVNRMPRSPMVEGSEHIPAEGPAVVAVNHYQRRGLWIGWPGAVITVVVAERRDGQRTHWLVTGAVRWRQSAGRGPEVPFSSRIFRTVARAYEMTALPLHGVAGRAAALRGWLRWLQRDEVCGIFPEGLRGRSGRLGSPERGFETLCRLFRRGSVPVVPCAVFERGDTLCVRFGEPVAAERLDSDSVMRSISCLLPQECAGADAGGTME